MRSFLTVLVPALLAALFLLPASARAATEPPEWRIVVREAAVAAGERVRLGEIADMVGALNQQVWQDLAERALWEAPPSERRPMVISRQKLAKALLKHLPEFKDRIVLPVSLVLQRGGSVLLTEDLAQAVVNALTPKLAHLQGEPRLRDMRLPDYVFLDDAASRLEVQVVGDVEPGRLSLRLAEVDAAGEEGRKVSGSVFLDLWRTVPAASRPLNRDEPLRPDDVTHVRKNMAFLRDAVWDGRGGPWRVRRPVGAKQVIYAESLEPLPAVCKGDTVSLVYQGERIRLKVPAVAMADGARGETIPVRNVQSDKEVYARVRDNNTVTVQ
jgi:flagella basal body P-ring formation protein FlgA